MISGRKPLFSPIAFALLFAWVFVSCGDKYLFNEEKDIPNAQWSYTDTLDFKVPVSDTAQLYNLYIRFTHADTFPNQNVYLKLYTRFPDGKRISRIRSFELYDALGKPMGNCSGEKCEARILLQDNMYFNQLGDHLITLEQFTRTSPLKGLASVGIMLEKTGKKR